MSARIFTRRFGEAFMLMKYQQKSSGHIEWLWNSRDGISPFTIPPPAAAPEGEGLDHYMSHADWGEDVIVPNFVPPVGMRVFIDAFPDPTGLKPNNVKAIVVDQDWHDLFRKLAETQPYRQEKRG